jgi:hypothetical protein
MAEVGALVSVVDNHNPPIQLSLKYPIDLGLILGYCKF